MPKLTQTRLQELLHYDSNTGVFIRKINGLGYKKGDKAGYINSTGYVQIKVNNIRYFGHRLAWLYVYGYFPEYGIDHRDRVPWHNWISNLREASCQCNARNTGNHITNTSGVKGVCWKKRDEKWSAYIMVFGKDKHLGLYKDFTEAVCARLAGEQCLNWSGCDSSSPAYRYVRRYIQQNG